MRALRLLLLLGLALPVRAQDGEDTVHRADRLRTAALNRQVAADVARRGKPRPGNEAQYRAARDRYERERAEWRARVDACEAGDWNACS